MVLTKMQIEALTQKICTEINTIINNKNNILKKNRDKEFKTHPIHKIATEYNKLIKQYNNLLLPERKLLQSQRELPTINPRNFIQIDEIPLVKDSTIRNDIVIATIECENIDEIINKIKDKYTK
jgi:hypothetical protein